MASQRDALKREGDSQLKTIGFRLDVPVREALEDRARALDLSPHSLARQYVIEGLLADEERWKLREAMNALSNELNQLREEFAHAVQTLLVSAGQVPPKEAEEWVQENFNQK